MNPDVTFTQAFPSLLVTCAFKGTLFLLLTGLIALITSSASRRHFVWVSSFLGLAVLVLLELFSPWRLEILPSWSQASWFKSAQAWLLPVWMIGLGLFILRTAIGMISLICIQRRSAALNQQTSWNGLLDECRQDIGVQRHVQLLHFPGRIMPMTWGVLRSFIVLPMSAMSWNQDRIRAVLMHEMAHIRRGDFLATLMRDCINALYWFHPLVWWAAREMDEDREEASDDVVMAAGHGAVPYAEHLAAVATGNFNSNLTVARPRIALANRPLVMRIRSILAPWKSRHPITWMDRFQLGALVASLALLAGVLAPRQSASLFGVVDVDGHSKESREANKALAEWEGAEAPPAQGGVSSWQTMLSQPLATTGWNMIDQVPYLLAPIASLPPFAASTALLDSPFDLLAGNSAKSVRPIASSPLTVGEALSPPAEYSTAPPDEGTSDAPHAFEFEANDIIPNLGNVALNGVDEFAGDSEFKNYTNIPPNLPDDVVAEFIATLRELEKQVEALFGIGNEAETNPAPPANNFVFDSGLFQTAGALISEPQPLVASVDKPITRLITEKLFVDQPAEQDEVLAEESQRDNDNGLETQVTIVKSLLTGERHLGISFWRKPNFPTAKYWIEASEDMSPSSWVDNQDLFVLAKYGLREDGRQVVVVVLTKPMSESSYRYMRVRSTHEL